jgi:hypothetical protein
MRINTFSTEETKAEESNWLDTAPGANYLDSPTALHSSGGLGFRVNRNRARSVAVVVEGMKLL